MSVDLRQLQHLLLLAEELNFGRAARRAHLSQSAFTRSIQALESSAGLRLFDRGNRYVRVTPGGKHAVEHARRLLGGARDLERDLELMRSGELGHVAVGSGPFASRVLLSPLIRELLTAHAGVTVKLEVLHGRNLIIERLRNEAIDFYVGSIGELSRHPDLETLRLGHVAGDFYAHAGHPLLRKTRVTGADLAHFRLAVVNLSDEARQLISEATGGDCAIAIESDNLAMLIQLATTTDLVLAAARVPHPLTRANSRLRVLKVAGLSDSPKLRNDVALVRVAGRSLTPAGELLFKRIIETTRQPNAGNGWFTAEPLAARRRKSRPSTG